MLTSKRTSPEDVYPAFATTRLWGDLPADDVLPTQASVRLGAELKARRKALDMSLIQAACACGVPATRLMRLESGRAEEGDILYALVRLPKEEP